MGETWKLAYVCLVISFFKLCNGFPIHFERTIADPQIQVLSGVLAVVVTICTLLLIAGCLCCQRGSGFKEFRDSPVTISAVGNVDTGLVNPTADGAFTIFAPLSQQNLSVSKERFRSDDDYIYRDINVTSWFDAGERDFPRTKLKYIRELGKGWFGRVVEGTAQDLEAVNTWTPVVVRILDSTATTKERVLFLHEADIYRCGEHTNILKLYGRCLDVSPFLLLQEYYPQGDLKNYLLSNRPNADNLLASEYPLIWCCQLTSAVKFLHEKGLAHSDLACRNCHLASNLTLKLGDYGLAAIRYPEDYYEGAISVRWCAPESIRHTSTTIRSDQVTREANVWSLAVCFWEVCGCADRPYSHLTDDEVVELVLGKGSVRLGRPSKSVLYADYIYRLMKSCWLTPESRPTATQIYLTLTDLLQVFTVCKAENDTGSAADSQEPRESFDARWNSLKPNVLEVSERAIAETSNEAGSKPTSPSLNNLIGSLEDMNASRTSDEYNAHSVLLPTTSNQKFEFKLGPQSKDPLDTDSLNDSMIFTMRRSSSSETEEENWKRKIERGVYTEKVRQKSRSVTDLMVLTHIDYSESESETPQPSLDHRVNYKNVRLAPKNNLDGAASYVHGSEGNLLSVQDDFQAELRKLQEEHRDSLFFVPDKFSRIVNKSEQVNINVDVDDHRRLTNTPTERLFKELNCTAALKPTNQVYNVFSVTIDNISPVHAVKLNEIINLEEPKTFVPFEVPKLCEIIRNNSNASNLQSDRESPKKVDSMPISEDRRQERFLEKVASCTSSEESITLGEMDMNVENVGLTESKCDSLEHQDKFEETDIQFDVPVNCCNSDIDEKDSEIEEETLNEKGALSFTSFENGYNDGELHSNHPGLHANNVELIESNHNVLAENRRSVTEVSRTESDDIDENNESAEDRSEVECNETYLCVCDVESSNSLFIGRDVGDRETSSLDAVMESISNGATVDSVDSDCFLEEHDNKCSKESSEETMLLPSLQNSLIGSVLPEVTFVDHVAEISNPKNIRSSFEEDHLSNVEVVENDLRQEISNGTDRFPVSCYSQAEMTFVVNVPDKLENNVLGAMVNYDGERNVRTLEETENHSSLANFESNTDNNAVESCKLFLDRERKANGFAYAEQDKKYNYDSVEQACEIDVANNREISFQNRREETKSSNQKKLHQVPKLIELIENDDKLMNYIISNYESELRDDLSCDNSRQTNSSRSDDAAAATVDDTSFPNMVESDSYPVVDFDLSNSQDATNPNSLTHLNAFSNVRSKHMSLNFSASTPTKVASTNFENGGADLIYSLETWDHFLGKAIDTQNRSMDDQTFVFESLEPRSLMFLEDGEGRSATTTPPNSDTEETSLEEDGEQTIVLRGRDVDLSGTYEVVKEDMNETFIVAEDDMNDTYDVHVLNSTFTADITGKQEDESRNWNSSGGWFLHPQSSAATSGTLNEQKDARFEMDEEILAVLRGELLAKLPHAQGTSSDKLKENHDWDPREKDEVFLRYNVFNTPLSPIPEESDTECFDNSMCSSPGSSDSDTSDDWPEKILDGAATRAAQDVESQSLNAQGRHRHTPSQDSCCSNDTLFNLEDITCIDLHEERGSKSDEKSTESDTVDKRLREEAINYFKNGSATGTDGESPLMDLESPMEQVSDKTYLMDFLVKEREHSEIASMMVTEPQLQIHSVSNSSKSVPLNNTHVAPLPSPDDHPWKHLSASLLIFDRSNKKEMLDLDKKESDRSCSSYANSNDLPSEGVCEKNEMDPPILSNASIDENYLLGVSENSSTGGSKDSSEINMDNIRVDDRSESRPDYENVPVNECNDENDIVYVNGRSKYPCYENVNELVAENCPNYVNVNPNDCNFEDRPYYVNLNVIECNVDNRLDYENVIVNDRDVGNHSVYESLNVNDFKNVNRPDYKNVKMVETIHSLVQGENDEETANIYDNVEDMGDVINEEDYVSITNLENCKMDEEFRKSEKIDVDETILEQYRTGNENMVSTGTEEAETPKDESLYGVLTDIRFSGPGGEPHLMSTSFSESNNDEKDWDSGSDTRSSSSGEFIWKEGEHEESLKALQALPQDPLDVGPKEGNREETSSESSCSDEDGECPEFIPSAWDKYATPTKSAMRSPEKTLEKEEKKKGVWFKKQRYHCVYEYPREPESPVLQSFDLWNNTPPPTSYPDWYFDIDSASDFSEFTNSNFQDGETLSTDFSTGFNDEFYVTSSATPFDMMTGSTSQFFPGDHWSDASKLAENTTPDSGVEDATPGSLERIDLAGIETSSSVEFPTLKLLTEEAHSKLIEKESRSNDILGGLRHTRDKLKLDLPTSPNTFTANKSFSLEPATEPVILRERPSFTTFGKSRFMVQHVDTPDKDPAGKNVCFEALPYKPPEMKPLIDSRSKKTKREEEKGEASLLDSADEDSGIESSTLERRSANVTAKLIVDL